MKDIVRQGLIYVQLLLLYLSYYFFKTFVTKKINKWVIGVDDIASTIHFIGEVLRPSIIVSLSKSKFYSHEYDYSINIKNMYLNLIIRIFYAPVLLGYLSSNSSHFFYIWSTGFLLDRNLEFKFLRSKKKKLACLFVGNDIRSLQLTREYAANMKIDTYANYIIGNLSAKNENDKKLLAASADRYADIIFNAKVDQMSYLENQQYGWTYMYDKDNFDKNDDKFDNIEIIKILHAPSNPIPKGTQLVRAAIKKLELEGYDFEYIEIQNMKNEVVLEHLKTTHIVLNQFYAFSPGLFGIEAMANHTAVLMSADPSIETTLHQDSQDAWMITKYWEVYDNLKYLLDNPEKIKYYADKGYDFSYKHYTYEAARESIETVLKEQGII